MRTPKFIGLLIIAATLVGVAQAESFVRATGSYYNFSNDRYSHQGGFGIAAGYSLGDQDAHELSLEWNYLKWGYLEQPAAGIFGGTMVSGSGKFQPVLFSYRYRMGDKNARVRFYVGPSLGYTNTEGVLMSSGSGPFYYSGGYSKWSFTYSASAGIQVLLWPNLSLDVGCRYIVIDGVEASLPYHSVNGSTGNPLKLNLGDTKALALSLGLHFAF